MSEWILCFLNPFGEKVIFQVMSTFHMNISWINLLIWVPMIRVVEFWLLFSLKKVTLSGKNKLILRPAWKISKRERWDCINWTRLGVLRLLLIFSLTGMTIIPILKSLQYSLDLSAGILTSVIHLTRLLPQESSDNCIWKDWTTMTHNHLISITS